MTFALTRMSPTSLGGRVQEGADSLLRRGEENRRHFSRDCRWYVRAHLLYVAEFVDYRQSTVCKSCLRRCFNGCLRLDSKAARTKSAIRQGSNAYLSRLKRRPTPLFTSKKSCKKLGKLGRHTRKLSTRHQPGDCGVLCLITSPTFMFSGQARCVLQGMVMFMLSRTRYVFLLGNHQKTLPFLFFRAPC